MGWGAAAVFSFVVSVLLLLKNTGLLVVFIVRKYLEHRSQVAFRPCPEEASQELPKLNKQSIKAMQHYLLDPASALQLDDFGNSALHTLAQDSSSSLKDLQTLAESHPYLLFVLNHKGYVPLDLCILNSEYSDHLDATQDNQAEVTFRNDGDNERPKFFNAKKTRRIAHDPVALHQIDIENK